MLPLQVDQPHEHRVVDAENPDQTKTLVIEPDRHGMTIRFKGTETCLVLDLAKGAFSVHCFEGERYKELLYEVR